MGEPYWTLNHFVIENKYIMFTLPILNKLIGNVYDSRTETIDKNKIRHIKCIFAISSKFSRNFKRNPLSQAMFSFDIKRIFPSDLQQNRYLKLIYCDMKLFFAIWNDFFLRYEANFIAIWSNFCAIWSEFRYLKQNFRFEVNF